MTKTTKTSDAPMTAMPAAWQQAYLVRASAVGTSWLDFMGKSFQAYVHAIDDISHCEDLNEAWRVRATFGQQMVKAYSEQAAKLGSMMMLKTTNGDAGDRSH